MTDDASSYWKNYKPLNVNSPWIYLTFRYALFNQFTYFCVQKVKVDRFAIIQGEIELFLILYVRVHQMYSTSDVLYIKWLLYILFKNFFLCVILPTQEHTYTRLENRIVSNNAKRTVGYLFLKGDLDHVHLL